MVVQVDESQISECGKNKENLENLLDKVQTAWQTTTVHVESMWTEVDVPKKEMGLLVSKKEVRKDADMMCEIRNVRSEKEGRQWSATWHCNY